MTKEYFIIQVKYEGKTFYIKDYYDNEKPYVASLWQIVEPAECASDVKLLFNSFKEAYDFRYNLLNKYRLLSYNSIKINLMKKIIEDGETIVLIKEL